MSAYHLLIFLFGLVIGSFLNCLIYRLEKRESFLFWRSYCPHCQHQLGWQDLIPIFSFLILQGRCRYCQKKISWQYPLIEISTALIFLLIFNFQFLIFNEFLISNFLNLIYYWIIACFLIIIFVYDLKHYIIPDKIIYPAIALTLFYQLFGIWNLEFVSNFEFRISDFQTLITPLFSAIFASAFFFSIILISRGQWMGMGDVKLAALIGLFLGWPNILIALFLAFFIGAVVGAGLIISGKKTLKSEVPFAPFLVTGTFIALFLGQNIINWYLRLIEI